MFHLPRRPGSGALLSNAIARLVKPRPGQSTVVESADVGSLPPKFHAAANPRTMFEGRSFEIDAGNAENLDLQAAWLRTHADTGVILIASGEGKGTELARHRADAVRTALVLRGIAFDRIRLTIVANIAADGELGMTNMVLTEVASQRNRREAPLVLAGDMLIEGTARPRKVPQGMTNRPRRMVPRDIRPQRPTVDWARG